MRKVVSFILVFVLCLALTACGEPASQETPAEDTYTPGNPAGTWYSTDGVTWNFNESGVLVLSQGDDSTNATWHITDKGMLISYGTETTDSTFTIEGDVMTLVNHTGDTVVLARMGSNAQIVAEFVVQNRTLLKEKIETLFTAGTEDMTCSSSIETKGTGFIINIRIPNLNNTSAEIVEELKTAIVGQKSRFDEALAAMQSGVPQLTYFTMNVCDGYGYVLFSVTADNA